MNGEMTARSGSLTLAEFINARLAEDESYAREPQGWNEYDAGDPGDPARVLRQVTAMRAILTLHAVNSEPQRWGIFHSDPAMRGQLTGETTYWCDECDPDHVGGPDQGCMTLRMLAAVWSDHRDYRQEWKL